MFTVTNKSKKGRKSNLHSVWDGAIIESIGKSNNDLIAELDSWLGSQNEQQLSKGTPVSWAEDGHAIAQGKYVKDGATINKAYIGKAAPVVRK